MTTLYSNPDHEVLYRILELLPTVEEALQHMVTQIDELRLEGAEVLFKDASQAIGSIASNFILLTTEQVAMESLQSAVHIREAIGAVIDGFEASNLLLIHTALLNSCSLLSACGRSKWNTSCYQRSCHRTIGFV